MTNPAIRAIEQIYSTLYGQEAKVADYVLRHPDIAAKMTVTELAERSRVSEATVMRFSKKTGFKGFYHLKISLARQSVLKQTITDDPNLSTVVRDLFKEKIADLEWTQQAIDVSVLQETLNQLKKSQMVYLFAAGNTNNLAAYASYLFNQLGVKAISTPLPEAQLNLAYQMRPTDFCLLLSDSGGTKLILDIAEICNQNRIPMVALTSQDKSPLTQLARRVLLGVHRAPSALEIAASTRLPLIAILDLLVTLLAADDSGHYVQYGSEREGNLAQYKY